MGKGSKPRSQSFAGFAAGYLPQVGDVIAGKYRIESALGQGGMGVVYLARHNELGHRVAIKVVRPDVDTGGSRYERFRREAQIAARIPSERVAKVSDFGKLDNGLPFLVMEYLSGSDLRAEIGKRGPLPIEEAVDHVIQACEPTLFAHAAGIVHRDLKPENLFLVRGPVGRPVIKVLDFGISKLLDSAAGLDGIIATTAAVGSPAYMSPEQIARPSEVDTRTDIWALGAVLYSLLTGRLPFEREAASSVLVAIVNDEPTPPRTHREGLPSALEEVILQCLRKAPAERPADVRALARLLAPFASDHGRVLVDELERASVGKIGGLFAASRRDGADGADAAASPPSGTAATAPLAHVFQAETVTRDAVVSLNAQRAAGVSSASSRHRRRDMWPFALGTALVAGVIGVGVARLRAPAVTSPPASSAATTALGSNTSVVAGVIPSPAAPPPAAPEAPSPAPLGTAIRSPSPAPAPAARAPRGTPAARPSSHAVPARSGSARPAASASTSPGNSIDRPEFDERK